MGSGLRREFRQGAHCTQPRVDNLSFLGRRVLQSTLCVLRGSWLPVSWSASSVKDLTRGSNYANWRTPIVRTRGWFSPRIVHSDRSCSFAMVSCLSWSLLDVEARWCRVAQVVSLRKLRSIQYNVVSRGALLNTCGWIGGADM